MSSQAVRRAFTHRVRALARELPGALEDDVEALHRSRVASRRVREILPVLEVGEDTPRGVASLRHRVRQLTRTLGGVRELDVSLAILDELAGRHPDLAGAVAAVRADVAEARRARREAMGTQVEALAALQLPDELERLAPGVGIDPPAGRLGILARRLARRADRLEAATDEAGALYVPERLHEVRIAAKQLRYALELVHEFGGVATRRLTNRVKRYQDLLGRLHDLEVLSGQVRKHLWAGTDGLAEGAARLQGVIDRDIRELHAAYLAGAGALHDVVVACRADIQPRLAAARRHPRPARGAR
jgi:CHAD domain-containing protein